MHALLIPTHQLLPTGTQTSPLDWQRLGGLTLGHPLICHITSQLRVSIHTLRHARNGLSSFLQINLHLPPCVRPTSLERKESLVTIASPPTIFLGSHVAHLLCTGSCALDPWDSNFYPANSLFQFRVPAVLLPASGLSDLPPHGLRQAGISAVPQFSHL